MKRKIKEIKSKIPQPIKKILKNIFYYYRKIPFIKLLVRYFKIRRLLKFPKSVEIEVTNFCNARCPTCENPRLRRPKGCMDMNLFKKIIDECFDHRKYIKDIVLFWMGEPFLDPAFFDKVKYIKNKYNKFSLITVSNGLLLDKKMAQKLIDSGLEKISFSFDGNSKESFEKSRPGLVFEVVQDNIKQLINLRNSQNKTKPKVSVEMTINPYNSHEVDSFFATWNGLADVVWARPMHVWGGETIDKGLLKFSRNLVKKKRSLNHPCFRILAGMIIAQDGSVALCCVDAQIHEVLGDLNKQSMVDVWQKGRLAEIRDLHQRGRLDEYPLCRRCNFRHIKDDPWWWFD